MQSLSALFPKNARPWEGELPASVAHRTDQAVIGILALMTKWRVAAAFLIAPLAAPFVFSVISIATHPSDIRDLSFIVGQFIVACLYVVPFAYLSAFLPGIPIWMIFRHYKIYSLPAFAVGGAFIGLFAALILGAVARTPITTLLNPLSPAWVRGGVLACVLAASTSAVVFRSIVFRASKEKK